MTAALRARLQALHARMIALQKAADDASRPMTAEEVVEYEKAAAEFDTIKADIERRTKAEARVACMAESAGRRTAPAAGGIGVGMSGQERDPRSGFRDMADFASAVRLACTPGNQTDPRLAAMRNAGQLPGGGPQNTPTGFSNEGTGVDGGYMVPPEMRADIWSLVFEGEDLINMVTAEPTSANAVDLLADETTPWGALGIKAKWRNEATQMATSGKPVAVPRSVRLEELIAFCTASGELLEDAPRLASRLTDGAARAIRWTASDALMWGTGAGQPLGWMNSPGLVTIAAEAAQPTATIVTANITKMYARLLYMGTGRARYLGNREILPALMGLTLGQNGIFMLPNAGLPAAPNGALLGLPLQWNEHCRALGTSGDLQLVDFDGYYLVQKAQGVKYDTSIHLFFDYNLQAFRWIFRLGGQPFLSTPVTPANGTATRSHFVVLADRP